MTGVAVLGPWPGSDLHEAQVTAIGALGDLPEGLMGLPPMVRLEEGGPWAEPVARGAALLTEMAAEVGPHGWKLADRPGRDLERVHAAAREAMDVLAVAAYRYEGPLVVSVPGPWTLAATLYLARGDRVLSDTGAVRELIASLGDGLGSLLGSIASAVPGARPVVMLREPMIDAVLDGAVLDFSGHGRLWSVPHEIVTAGVSAVVTAAREAGASQVVVHTGESPRRGALSVAGASGGDAVAVPSSSLGSAQWEQLAGLVEEGIGLWFAVGGREGRIDPTGAARRVAGPWTAVGLPAAGLSQVVVHADLAGRVGNGHNGRGDLAEVRPVVAATTEVAARLAEQAAGA